MKNLLFLSAIILTGCEPSTDMTLNTSSNTGRFTVSRVGVVEDSLSYNSKRGVYIISDAKTGKEYVGVSGIGISELGSHKVDKMVSEDEQ